MVRKPFENFRGMLFNIHTPCKPPHLGKEESFSWNSIFLESINLLC